MSRVFGIDLGTTNSAVAYMSPAGPKCVLTPGSSEFLPSKVLFDAHEVFVGAEAVAQFENSPTTGVYIEGAKRLLGSTRGLRQRDPPWYSADQWLRPVDVGALVLCGLKTMVRDRMREPLERAVITHPQHFRDPMKRATEHAAQLAGIQVEGLLCEPFAAALAYGFAERSEEARIMVFDLGGGTLDITIVEAAQGRLRELGSAGDPKLGGRDFDEILLGMFTKNYKLATGDGPRGHEVAIWRNLAEATKIRLANEVNKRLERGASEVEQVAAKANVVLELERTGLQVKMEVTERDFRSMAGRRRRSIMGLCTKALENAGQTWQTLTDVVFAGGGSLLPMVRDLVSKLTSATIRDEMDPSTVVALGAACFADSLAGGGGPALEASVVATSAVPDDGPAQPSLAMPLITAKTTQALGVGLFDPATQQERVFWLVEPGTEVPCKVERMFPTVRAGQTDITVRFFEGSPEKHKLGVTRVSSLHPIGTCVLELPAPLPAGTDVKVVLRAEVGGPWKASVTDPESGRSAEGVFSQPAATSQPVVNQPEGDTPWYPPDEERAEWLQSLEIIT